MSSSEDDVPLVRGRKKALQAQAAKSAMSKETVAKSVDREMDKEAPSGDGVAPAISIHNIPADQMKLEAPQTNGVTVNGTSPGKRKSHPVKASEDAKSDASEDEDDKPLLKRQRISRAAAKKNIVQNGDIDSDDEPIAAKKSAGLNATRPKPTNNLNLKVPSLDELKEEKKAIEEVAEKEAKAIRKAERSAASAKTSGKAKEATGTGKKQKTSGDNGASAAAEGKRPRNGKVSTPTGKTSTPTGKTSTPTGKTSTPTGKASTSTGKKAGAVKRERDSVDADSDDDQPLVKKAAKKLTKAKSTPNGKQAVPRDSVSVKHDEDNNEDGEEKETTEEEYRWWENNAKGDGSIKWTTLQHNGVVFPPPYEPLPQDVKMKYDGIPLTLHPEAEEVAGFFGAMLNSTHNVENPTFVKNFFHDFSQILKATGGAKGPDGKKVPVKEFAKCDFQPIFDHYEAKRAEKKALSAAEKKRLKAEKDAAEAPYQYCMWDGRKEKVGNFRVEPPGLFRGRGEHPKTGHVKKRVMPEQITINIGKDAVVPAPPEGHRWKEVKHDQTGTWLAMWQENINNAYKYVMLAATSAIKGQSDFKKFEKARELKKHIDRIREDYRRDLKAEMMSDRQRATAVYLIDQLALRAGNEKGEDEADTVGCCSLKFEHITLKPPNTVIFDFLGKDSIRFYDEVAVDEQVFKNLKIFKRAPKGPGDEIFDRLKPAQLNAHLSNYMQGLSAKVFRTYNASYTMAQELAKLKPDEGTIAEKVKEYNEANRRVAILCNHKRTVPASHEGQMEKLAEKIKGLKYQKWRIKQQMLQLEPGLKKKKGADFFKLDDELTSEWVLQHQAALVDEARQRIEKKFQKDNEKRVADGESVLPDAELQQRLEEVQQMEQQYKAENKSKKIEVERKYGSSVERMQGALDKLDERIRTMLVQAEMRESTKEVALGTSKINYIDPRLTVTFSKKFNVPLDRFFSKALREKFDWAIKSVDEDWEF